MPEVGWVAAEVSVRCSVRCAVSPQCRLLWPPACSVWQNTWAILTSSPTASTGLEGSIFNHACVIARHCSQASRMLHSLACGCLIALSITSQSRHDGCSRKCLFFCPYGWYWSWLTTAGCRYRASTLIRCARRPVLWLCMLWWLVLCTILAPGTGLVLTTTHIIRGLKIRSAAFVSCPLQEFGCLEVFWLI